MKTLCCLLSLFLCTCASEIKYYQGYIYMTYKGILFLT